MIEKGEESKMERRQRKKQTKDIRVDEKETKNRLLMEEWKRKRGAKDIFCYYRERNG